MEMIMLKQIIGFGKSDGTASRSGAAIASVQTGSDPDSYASGFYTTPGSSSVQTLAQKVLIATSGNVGIGRYGSIMTQLAKF